MTDDPRIAAVPDIHGHAKGEHKLFVDERPIPYTARMLFLWFFHACRRGAPRFLMVADHVNYLTFEDPAAVNLVRRALKLAHAGDLYGAAETAGVDVQHAAVVGEGLRRGMRYSIGAEVDNDPRSRPDAQNIVDAMRPDGIVRSVHFLPIKHPQHGEWMWPFDNPEFRDVYDIVGTEQTWELYMATLLDAIEKLPGHIVGHFYVPAKFGHWPSDEALEAYEDRLLDACAERGMAVEINSRYYYKQATDDEAQLERYSAANLRLLRKAKEKGVLVAVGSDAHSPKDQGRGFAEVLALLDRVEINEIAFPIDGRLARVALRATDELRAANAKAARTQRAHAIPIPGTEEPDQDDETASAQGSERPVAAETSPAAATSGAPKKRPSRAKKARAADVAPSGAEESAPAATAAVPGEVGQGESEPETPAEPAQSPAAAVVEALVSVAKRVTQKLADTLQSREAAPSEAGPVEPVAAAPDTHAAEPEAATREAAEEAPETPEVPLAEVAEPRAALPDTPAEATFAEAEPPEAAPTGEIAHEPEPAPAASQGPAATALNAPETVTSESSSGASERPRISPSRPATPVSALKRSVKAIAKAVRRVKPAAKAPAKATSAKAVSKAAQSKAASKTPVSKAAVSKATPAAKKRAIKKAAPAAKKVARPGRSAGSAAKKAAAKKVAPARKATKAPVKTASRTSAKKATAKKTTAKKKATKSRR